MKILAYIGIVMLGMVWIGGSIILATIIMPPLLLYGVLDGVVRAWHKTGTEILEDWKR